MNDTKINGGNIGIYSRMSKKCRKCRNRDYCNSKKIEGEAYIIGVDLAAGHDFTNTQQIHINAMNNAGVTAEQAADTLTRAMRSACAHTIC